MSQEYSDDDGEEYDYAYEDNVSEEGNWETEDRKADATVCNAQTLSSRKLSESNRIIDFIDVIEVMNRILFDVHNLLEIDLNIAQYILQKYNWNKEKIMESYFENSEKLFSSCGVDNYISSKIQSYFRDKSICDDAAFTCKVCYDDFSDVCTSGFSLGCGHTFCKTCFGEYLKGQVNNGPLCVQAHCPEHKCNQAVTRDVFRAFLSSEMIEKFECYVSKHFVECNKNMRFCPAANCDKVLVCGESLSRTIACTCLNVMCFRCGEEAHEPTSCAQLQVWNEKCASDGESSKWIFANTKKCPKCYSRIEKNQGCLHMVCRQCGHNFCWVCMGTHHVWVCNEFKPTVDESAELNAQQKAKAELERYHHYFNRYHNHDQALKFASKQRSDALLKMKQMQEQQSDAWIDVQYVQDAVETVVACRRVLKYTYVIGYYLPENSPEKLLFDRHQEMLEENTERLHECTEGKNIFTADRTQVVNWTRITDKFRKALLESYVDGVNVGASDESAVSSEQIAQFLGGAAAAETTKPNITRKSSRNKK